MTRHNNLERYNNSMTLKLSHSAASRYMKCGESYKLWYVDKFRPRVVSGSLLFGSALDLAINALLLNEGEPLKVFMDNWESGWISKKKVELPFNTQIVYAQYDFDKDLITKSDLEKLSQALKALKLDFNDPMEAQAECQTYKKQKEFRTFKENENQYLNYCYWLSLYRKAELILEAYKKEVLPKIKKVISVQKEINFENETGDKITGVLDLVAEWEDGHTYILDNKSSSRAYSPDSVKSSAQLTLYANHEKVSKAGFIVYLKNIDKDKTRTCSECHTDLSTNRVKTCNNEIKGKRCGGAINETMKPRAIIQIILDDVNPNMTTMVMDNFENVNKMIKSGVYLKNFDNCDNWYGAECPFKSICYKGDYSGLDKE